MKRPGQIQSVQECEAEITRALADLRRTDRNNTMAVASIEYRIGRLRERKAALERA